MKSHYHFKLGLCITLMLLLGQWEFLPSLAARTTHKAAKVSAHSKSHAKKNNTRPKTAPKKTTKYKRAAHGKSVSKAQGKKPAQAPNKKISTKPSTTRIYTKAVAPKSDSSPPASQLGPGVQYRQFTRQTGAGPVRINLIEVDPKVGGIEIAPVLANSRMGSKNSVANMVNYHRAVAGINGSFFKQDVGIPLGILMINEELISGPIYDRVALGITRHNDLLMDRVHLGGEIILPSGHKVALHNVNQPRIKPNHTVVYSSRWGSRAPKVPNKGIQIALQNNRVVAVSRDVPLIIPRDGMVISGNESFEMTELAALHPSQSIRMNVYTLPDWSGMKHAIGGGPWLVKNGQPYIDVAAQNFGTRVLGYREPRSAVGITRSGKMILVAVDGRRPHVSVGMTLQELSYLMRDLGSIQAMNLDGGSSTQMAVHGKIVNTPSSGQIGVSNSLIVRQANPDNMALNELNGEKKSF